MTHNGATGWGGDYYLVHGDVYAHSGNQYAGINSIYRTVSQDLHTSGLRAGDTLTISFFHSGATMITLGSTSFTTELSPAANYRSDSISYTLTTDAEPLTLTFAWAEDNPYIDDVSASCVRPEPTSTPSPTPTDTPIPTDVPTETPIPTQTPSPTPEPTDEPVTEVEITVSGDPRFPVAGSVALTTPDLTYSLLDAPDQGSVVVQPGGAFTYTADSYLVTFDQFTVLASDGTVITVNVVLEIDPTVPTTGTVRPGGTGNGGEVEDPRSPTSSNPSEDDDEEDEENDSDTCSRCN